MTGQKEGVLISDVSISRGPPHVWSPLAPPWLRPWGDGIDVHMATSNDLLAALDGQNLGSWTTQEVSSK